MFGFLQPRYIKQGRQFAKDARKLLSYKRDLWSDVSVADFDRAIVKLESALKERNKQEVERSAQELDALCTEYLPPVDHAGWRENVEVFLVAIVIALGVRTYFLQPFTIPTSSMFPTLNGIIGTNLQESPENQSPVPNLLVRTWQAVWYGRTWVDVTAKADERIIEAREVSRFFIFTYTRVVTDKNVYFLHIPFATAQATFHIGQGRMLQAGKPIALGYHDTGDHVFVDKFTYNFRKPKRDEVFVFNTAKIEVIRTRNPGPSQYYIKRLAGTPGDTLRIDPPDLFINGERAKEPGFRRVMEAQGHYRGYANGPSSFWMDIMRAPDRPYTVPEKHYFALGDNSYQSSDGRDWGPVPQDSIMGRAVFVYWPFRPHFGGIQ